MKMNFSYGSVCSGIEAASVAWHTLGWRPAWFAEFEANPSAILAHRWPDVPNLGDMTLIARYVRAGYVEAPDVLVGGTPCQAFSVAGLRGGLTDARGQLTLTYVDLANAIDEKRGAGNECVIYWENVPGVLSDATNAFGCLLGALAGEDGPLVNSGGKWANAGLVVGPQRSIAWRVLDAQYFGVAQRRRRVFLVASARKDFDPAKLLFEFDGVRRHSAPRRETGQDATAGTLRSTDGGSDVDHARAGHVRAVAVVPVCPTLRAGGNSTGGDRPPGTDVDTCESLLVCASNGEGSTGLPFLTCSNLAKTVNNQTPLRAMAARSVALRGRDGGATAELGDDLAGCLRASGGGGDKAHVLAPTFFSAADYKNGTFEACETARTLTTSADRTRAAPVCVTGEITHTLKAEGFDASEDGMGVQANVAYTLEARAEVQCAQYGSAVRRLTPRECERLQGFPDDYTLVPMPERRATPRAGGPRMMADGPRYKALGNSMAVPGMRWLGVRLMLTHPEYFY